MVKVESIVGNPDQRYEKLLAERGGRIAYALFRLRDRLHLSTAREQSREELIAYHERLRQEPVGIIWPEEGLDEDGQDAWRIIGS